MGRYLHDQSKVVMYLESGTYGTGSTSAFGALRWPGQVQTHDIEEKQNVQITRFLGNLKRSPGQMNDGPLNVTGKFLFYPQDWTMLAYALGSVTGSAVAVGGNYSFTMSEVNSNAGNAFTSGTLNPPMSFTLEESRTGNVANKNSMRTIVGAVVNQYKLAVKEGKYAEVEIDFVAQAGSWFSGTTSTVTAGSNRPYLWDDCTVSIPGGTTMDTVKDLTFILKNGVVGPHYLNGSRVIGVPYALNRDYDVTIIQDLADTQVGSLYDTYFKGGSLFNAVIDLNNTQNVGSHHLILTLSGCRMTMMKLPAKMDGVVEVNYTFNALSGGAVAYDTQTVYTPF